MLGRDTFGWFLTKQGIFPWGHYDADFGAASDCGTNGLGCATKILKEGAMNY